MQTVEMITFLVIFVLIVLISCISINKEEEASERESLEAQNTEFDYGHNVDYKSK